jgi:ribose transport system substrate-binding protein
MEKNYMTRRDFLKVFGTTLGAAALASCGQLGQQAGGAAKKAFYTANVIRTLSNEYHAAWNRGGRVYAESIGQGPSYRALLCEGDSDKQLTLMSALIQEAGGKGGNVVFNIDPNQSPDAKPIADLCAENQIYFLTQWNKPDDLHPWDYNPYWVSHMGVDGVPSGKYVAEELFKAMGGSGKIVALQGLLANVPAIQRFDGLKQALAANTGIELLEDQTASWDRTAAVAVTEAFLAKYPDLGGIWAANDNMGLGALEALRTAGKAGTIPVVGIDGTSEAINAVIAGEFAATVNNDPQWQGSHGLALPYQAKTGVFDPTKQPNEHREFYFTPVYVNKDNAADVKKNYIDNIPVYDWTDLWGRVQK